MVKILLASHGEFSIGCESFLRVLVGTPANLFTLVAFINDQSIEELVEEKLNEIGEFDQLLIFCDLHGGSVEQEIYRQTITDKRNIQIIAGFNLALLLECILQDRVLSAEEIRNAIAESKKATIFVNDIQKSTEENDLF